MASIKSRATNVKVYFFLGCFVFFWGMMLALGGFCFDYVLNTWYHKDIPWWGDVICGLIGSALIVPAAIITFIIQAFGG